MKKSLSMLAGAILLTASTLLAVACADPGAQSAMLTAPGPLKLTNNHRRTLLNAARTHSRWGGALLALLAMVLACGACTGRTPATPSATPTPAPTATALAREAPAPTATAMSTREPAPTAGAIRVIKVMPEKKMTSNEQYEFSNCGGIEELRRPFSEAAQVWTEVVISDKATLSNGTTIPVSEPLCSQLVAEVQRAYQEELAAARAAVEQTEMVAGAQTRWNITVIWEDQVFAASVSFPSDSLTATAAYTYTQHVPIMGSVKPMPCTA